MNKDAFLHCIENSRDCNQFKLDAAINSGIYKAKSNKLDSRKFLMLAAACVCTFVMCITISLNPFKTATESYYQTRNKAIPVSAEVLDGYIHDIAINVMRFIGEE